MLDLKTTIKALKEDLKHLAGALHQLSTGAELGSVLKALPPTLLQVGMGVLLLGGLVCLFGWMSL